MTDTIQTTADTATDEASEAVQAEEFLYLDPAEIIIGTNVRTDLRADHKEFRKSIKELAEELDPSIFWRVHRATIVNLNAVQSVGRDLAGHVVLRLKDCREVLQVSQPYAHLFRQM